MNMPRRRGRPRDEQLTEDVLTAAHDILSTEGVASLTLEAVARRAGVSRTAIYKRWRSLADLMVDVAGRALARAPGPPTGSMTAPGTGSLATDLREYVLQGMATLDRLEQVGVAAPLIAESVRSTSLGNRVRAELFRGDDTVLRAILDAAVARGELAALPDDAGAVFHALVGYALYRRFLLHIGLDRDELDVLCRIIARGLGA